MSPDTVAAWLQTNAPVWWSAHVESVRSSNGITLAALVLFVIAVPIALYGLRRLYKRSDNHDTREMIEFIGIVGGVIGGLFWAFALLAIPVVYWSYMNPELSWWQTVVGNLATLLK